MRDPGNRSDFKCPLCSSALTKERWLNVTGTWRQQERLLREAKQREQAAEERGVHRERRRISYLQSLLAKRDEANTKLHMENQDLKAQLKRGTTPQMEGLLEEAKLCQQLQKRFPTDRVELHGKAGDILQIVRVNGKGEVGRLVFECKRCRRMPRHHIEQTRRALSQRKADYAILVTNASKVNTFGYWTDKDVLIVHPAGVMPLVILLRDALIKVAESKMTRNERDKAITAILDFVVSPEFRNPLRDIVRRSEQLGEDLKNEIGAHKTLWESRLLHYQAIWMDGCGVSRDFDSIMRRHDIGGLGRRNLVQAENSTYPISKHALMLQSPSRIRQQA